MKLYMNGIYRNTTSAVLIAELKSAGYQEVPEEPAPEVGSEQPETASIAQIYELCDKAGVNPSDLKFDVERPTLAQVKAAIKAVKKVGE